MLTPTSSSTAERVPVGTSEGGGGGSGGEPLRYGYTSRGVNGFSACDTQETLNSLFQINLGANPISKLEVVSSLNCLNISNRMYQYFPEDSMQKYTPKVYLGTSQTISFFWNYDHNFGPNLTWPQAFQGSQKGEANTEGKIICI